MSGIVRPKRNSELSVYLRCKLKWYFTFQLGFLSDKINWHFWLGTLVHYSLSEYHLGRTTDPAHLFYEITENWIAAERMESVTVKGIDLDFDNVADLENAQRLGIGMLEGYIDWQAEHDDIDGIDTELAYYIEMEDNNGRKFTFVCRLDLLGENSEGIRVRDFKTAGDFRDQKTVDTYQQFRRYPWAVRKAHPDWADEVIGSEWMGLRKIVPSSRSKPPYFLRVRIDLLPEDYEQIEKELIAEVTDLLDYEEKLEKAGNPRDVLYPNPQERCSWDCDYYRNGMCAAWRRGIDVTELGKAHGEWGVDPYLEYREEWESAVPVVIGRRDE